MFVVEVGGGWKAKNPKYSFQSFHTFNALQMTFSLPGPLSLTIKLQIVEEPTSYSYHLENLNSTRLFITFSSPKLTVKKEIWSYSTLDFVADCGGLLGLFIGFNFVMIWDLVVIIYQKIKVTF